MEQIIINIPTSWDDITVSQYDELRLYNLDSNIISSILINVIKNELFNIQYNDFKVLITILSILLDISEDVINKMEIESLKIVLNKLNWLKPIKTEKNIETNFNKFDVGKFIDLETVIENGIDKDFIKYVNRLFDKDMSNEPITKVYTIAYEYLNWRKKLFEDFAGLFEPNEDEEIKSSDEMKYENFNRKWNWYGFIYRLAGGDILKMEAVTEINVIGAFNYLSFEKERGFLNQK